MKILGIDSSGIVASVAVTEGETLLAEYTVNYKKTHSQTLLPMLDEVAKMTELDLDPLMPLQWRQALALLRDFVLVLQRQRDLDLPLKNL